MFFCAMKSANKKNTRERRKAECLLGGYLN